MEQKDLIEYKKYLNSLSYEELVERNKMLRGYQTGEYFGPMTGYLSIDKPWLKYYDNKDLELTVPQMLLNDYMDSLTKYYGNNIAFEYFNKHITYHEFKDNRDKVAKSLIALGIKPGDIVSVCLPNIPEVAYVFYAINKIGAIANMLDPRTNKSTITRNVNDAKSKLVITLDSAFELFTDTNVETIVPVSAINCLNPSFQNLIRFFDKSLNVKIPSNSHTLKYNDFLKLGEGVSIPDKNYYKKNSPAVIAYTGGTTGIAKGVIISNEAFNSMVVENSVMGYNSSFQDSLLNIAPPWTYYGLSNCLNAFLCLGIKSILIPKIGPDDLGKLINKCRPNHVITVPSALVGMINDKKLSKKELEFLKTLIVGADKLDPTFEDEVDNWLKMHDSSTLVSKGYGMTEVCAAAAYTKGETNEPGTVGIPYLFETIAIFDIDDYNKECRVDERGELAILGPKNMLGYFGESENETSEVLKEHDDGSVWVHTGDIGHVDKDGKIFIDGRLKRMFVRNGFKIFPGEIESQIMKDPDILQAAVIATKDSSNGYNTKAYIVLKEHIKKSSDDILEEIKELLKNTLYDYELPDSYEILSEMPLTPMNKIDFKALEKMNKDEVKQFKKDKKI